jgi:aryl-alcohol dehydrogenase-like predicted oxidoreductase
MKYKILGRTEIKVSTICLGSMTWGCQNTEQEGHAQMDYALGQGVNFLDTAEMYAVPPSAQTYGKTESIIGTWFEKTGNRNKVVLASKIAGAGLPWVRGGKNNIDRKNLTLALEASLKRLQTDYIDLYQLHWPNRGSYHFSNFWGYAPEFDDNGVKDNFLEVLETLDGFIKAGKVRAAGLSNETAWGTMKWLQLAKEKTLPRMATIQNEYSLLCRRFEGDLQETSMAEDIGLLAWSPLATGLLSGKYRKGACPKGARWSIMNDLPRNTKQAHEAVEAYWVLAQEHGLDISQMALAFVNSRPFVTANIIGATSLEQLKTNIDSINLELSPEILKEIDSIRRNYPIVY